MNYLSMRINKDQIKQYHISERKLSEPEIKGVPDKYWVNWFAVDKNEGDDLSWEKEIINKMREQSL